MGETIKVLETYGVYNLSSKHQIHDLISRLELPNSNQLIIDIKGCIVDYSTTSLLFDEILFHLNKLQGEKKLIILTDGLSFQHMFADLFLGSKFINVGDDFKLDIKECEFLLKEINETHNIEIIIKMANNSSA
jgi:hypothetical protein